MLFPPKWIFTVHQTKIVSTEFLKHRSSELHSMHCSILMQCIASRWNSAWNEADIITREGCLVWQTVCFYHKSIRSIEPAWLAHSPLVLSWIWHRQYTYRVAIIYAWALDTHRRHFFHTSIFTVGGFIDLPPPPLLHH